MWEEEKIKTMTDPKRERERPKGYGGLCGCHSRGDQV